MNSNTQWQPIETNTDGKWCILYNGESIGEGFKASDKWWWSYFMPTDDQEWHDLIDPLPTHWMPLPEPPK